MRGSGGDAQIGGEPIRVGQRVIDGAAKVMLARFFAAAESQLKAEAAGLSG